MIKVKRYKRSWTVLSSPLRATLSSSWVPLTLAFLIYTSGITHSLGDASNSENSGDDAEAANVTKKNYTLTGNPQIDYVHDPNLPRELNGYNLSAYPFFSRVPTNINFSCDGLKDGFYASIEHKCQVYHHCLFGTRYDFLCANYTAFDQKTFICQFVSDVDCPNSALFFHRNNDLYVGPTTTPPPPLRLRPGLYERRRPSPRERLQGNRQTSGGGQAPAAEDASNPKPAPAAEEYDPAEQDYESEEDYRPVRRKPLRRRCKNKRRCRQRRRRPRPRPVYYDDYEEYEDDYYDYDDYYDERPKRGGRRNKDKLKNKVAGSKKVEIEAEDEDKAKAVTEEAQVKASSTTSNSEPAETPEDEGPLDVEALANKRDEILNKARPPPKIRPPAPKDKSQGRSAPSTASTTTTAKSTSESAQEGEGDEYYYDNEEASPAPKSTPSTKATTTRPTTLSSRQKFINRNFRQSATSTTTASTTQRTTKGTTATTSTSTAPSSSSVRSRVVSPRGPPIPTTTSTTTTTTEAPQYEYEYEYEDEIVSSSPVTSPVTSKATTASTTTTTTTTQKPVRSIPTVPQRGKVRPFTQVSSTSSVSVQELPEDSEVDDSQNAINRRQSSWVRSNQGRSTSGQGQSTSTQPSVTTSSTTASTVQAQRGNSRQVPSPPVITVKSHGQSPMQAVVPAQTQPHPYQSRGQQGQSQSVSGPTTTENALIIRQRPSRFWQRPTKAVSSPSTTASPVPIQVVSDYGEGDYSDEFDPPQAPQAPPSRAPSTPPHRYRPTPSLLSSSTSSYKEKENPANYQSQRASFTQQSQSQFPQTPAQQPQQPQQYLRATVSSSSRREPNFLAQFGPSPSSVGIQYQHQIPPTTPSRPEFISLLGEDEEPFFEQDFMSPPRSRSGGSSVNVNPNYSPNANSNSNSNSNSHRRFPPRTQFYNQGNLGNFHNSQKNLYSAAGETYHSFLPAPVQVQFQGQSQIQNQNQHYMGLGMRDFFSPSGVGTMLFYQNQNQQGYGESGRSRGK